ncbi:hypothetical protein CEE45_14630 [Candidatus Heimdallarchaeota archaeon B3_Heim]|nr:MAG: hypothetical protein CEE45_14630 [Candidatus Heimdallarchaeota archaeon B3_Heim]
MNLRIQTKQQSGWLLKFIFRDFKKHKLRNLIAILSIGLSIGILVAMNATVDTLGNTYVDLVIHTTPDYDFEIRPTKEATIQNYSRLISSIKEINEIEEVTPRFISPSNMILSYELENDTRYDLIQLPATLIGLNISKENELGIGSFDPRIDNAIGVNKCLLVGNFGENVRTALNDNLSVNYFYLRLNNPITGVISEIKLEIESVVQNQQRLPDAFNQIVVDLSLIESWLNIEEICTTLIGKFKDPVYSVMDPEGSVAKAKDLAITIQSKIGIEEYSVSLPKALAIESADFTGFRLLLNFIGILILLLATILIYSLNTVSIQEKNQEYAMLRTIGIKDRKLLLMLFVTQLVNVFFGIIVGIVLGYVLSLVITNLLLSNIPNLSMTISTSTLTFSVFVGSVAGILSAIKPSVNLINRNITTSLEVGRVLNQEYSIQRERSVSKSMGLLGFAIASMGSVFFIILPLLEFLDNPLYTQILFLSLLLSFLIGSVLLTVGVLSPICEMVLVRIMIAFKYTRKIGIMTKTFLLKNQRRNSLTATIFALSMAFILYLSMSNSFQGHMMVENLRHYYGSDLVVQSSGVQDAYVDPSVVTFLESHNNVSSVSYVTTGSIFSLIGCQATLGDLALFDALTPSGIYGISDSNFDQSLYRKPIIQQPANQNAWDLLTNNNTVIISRSIANQLKMDVGDFIRLKISSYISKNHQLYGKDLNLSIVGIVDRVNGFPDVHIAKRYSGSSAIFLGNFTWNQVMLGKSINNSDQITAEKSIDRVFVKAKFWWTRTTFLETIQSDLFLEFGTSIVTVRIDLLLENLDTQLEQQRDQLAIILSLSLIIAFFSIFSSTQTSILESMREIGVIKAVGLKQRTITVIFISQAVILTVVSTILGGLVGYILALLSHLQSAIQTEFPIALIPVDAIIYQVYAISIVLAIIGTYIPVRSLKNKEPSEILRTL